MNHQQKSGCSSLDTGNLYLLKANLTYVRSHSLPLPGTLYGELAMVSYCCWQATMLQQLTPKKTALAGPLAITRARFSIRHRLVSEFRQLESKLVMANLWMKKERERWRQFNETAVFRNGDDDQNVDDDDSASAAVAAKGNSVACASAPAVRINRLRQVGSERTKTERKERKKENQRHFLLLLFVSL